MVCLAGTFKFWAPYLWVDFSRFGFGSGHKFWKGEGKAIKVSSKGVFGSEEPDFGFLAEPVCRLIGVDSFRLWYAQCGALILEGRRGSESGVVLRDGSEREKYPQ